MKKSAGSSRGTELTTLEEGVSNAGHWLGVHNSATELITASGASYIATFVRERCYCQRELGTITLNYVVVTVSTAAVMSNMAGTAGSLSWAAGRLPTWFRSAGVAVGQQNLDRCPELAVFATSDHDRLWHSSSVTSACAGSSACSDPLGGPRRTRTARSWCSATRCASSSANSMRASPTALWIGQSSPPSPRMPSV